MLKDGVIELRRNHNHEPDERLSQRLNTSLEEKIREDALFEMDDTMTGKDPSACSLCGKTYLHKESLARHFRRDHCNKRFSCQHCDKVYTEKFVLKKHMEKEHGQEFVNERTRAKKPKSEAEETPSEELWETFDDATRVQTGDESQDSEEDIKLVLSLDEIDSILFSLSLTSVTLGKYMVIMRSDFELTISGEPYTALVLLCGVWQIYFKNLEPNCGNRQHS